MLPATTRPRLLGTRPDLDGWLAAAAGRWHAADDADGVVHAVVGDLAALLPADAAVSVVVRGTGRRPRDPVASAPGAATLDAAQVAGGQGPLLEALGGTPAGSADLLQDPRWPRLACTAAATALPTATCLPLDTGREVLGALSVYATGEVPERATLAPVAVHAALALRSVQRIEHLAVALASRDVIGQAKGVLMERYRITAEAAFGILTRASQDTHRKVRDVAALVTETGEAPGDPRSADDGR
ncbi:ANTAR domain-containing protein [Geodermatophilus telluris]|uniref:ANTAR domain-containing protein n=1 Tax=Geodermatophilus telluris TaxID=1190417 RepID=A0A1G6VFG5_9ACTN|nr:ANTAR domain-containing protein [Geodermatophilus telluris]SDD51586.1 ANTAR domain-containing protein [Geodermatophilus telluris]